MIFNPQPASSGPSGYVATRSRAVQYTGKGGPGTFETSTLKIGGCKRSRRSVVYVRTVAEISARGAASTTSSRKSSPSTWCMALAERVDSLIA